MRKSCVMMIMVVAVDAVDAVVAVAPALEDSAPGNNFRKTLPGALSSNEGLDSPVSSVSGYRWR